MSLLDGINWVANALVNPDVVLGERLVPNQKRLVSEEMRLKHEGNAEKMLKAFNGEKLPVFNENNQKLDVFFFSGLDQGSSIHKTENTVIIFNGLGCYHYYNWTLVENYRKRGVNVVVFNHHGTGHSEGNETTRDGMIQDGEAIVDYLERTHRVPRNKLGVHGVSLGGGPSAIVASNREGVNAVNERSYAKLSLASEKIIQSSLGNIPVIGAQFVARNVAYYAFNTINWEFDTEEAWKKIKGKKCVVCHLKDSVISPEAGLYQAIRNTDKTTHFILMNDEANDPHSRKLTDQEMDEIVKGLGFKNLLLEAAKNKSVTSKQSHRYTNQTKKENKVLAIFKKAIHSLHAFLKKTFQRIRNICIRPKRVKIPAAV